MCIRDSSFIAEFPLMDFAAMKDALLKLGFADAQEKMCIRDRRGSVRLHAPQVGKVGAFHKGLGVFHHSAPGDDALCHKIPAFHMAHGRNGGVGAVRCV